MVELVVWGAISLAIAASCWWRPRPTRVFVGIFFAVMGLAIHGSFIATNPQSYVDFASSAPIPVYRNIGLALTEPSPIAFGVFMLVFELVVAALILGKGRYVKAGLIAAIVFLLGITPLGLEELPNLIFAAGVGYLLTQDYPTTAWTELRNKLGRASQPGIRSG